MEPETIKLILGWILVAIIVSIVGYGCGAII